MRLRPASLRYIRSSQCLDSLDRTVNEQMLEDRRRYAAWDSFPLVLYVARSVRGKSCSVAVCLENVLLKFSFLKLSLSSQDDNSSLCFWVKLSLILTSSISLSLSLLCVVSKSVLSRNKSSTTCSVQRRAPLRSAAILNFEEHRRPTM